MEEYKTIEGFINYEVSNYGNVRNIKTKRVLKPNLEKGGYQYVNLYMNKIITLKKNHRLVAETFLDNPQDKKCVDHIDNNKLNNHLINLRYATISENNQNSTISSRNTSGHKGISFHKGNNKWCARITIDGIQINLGYFENKEDAINIRISKANQLFGNYTNACEKI